MEDENVMEAFYLYLKLEQEIRISSLDTARTSWSTLFNS